MNDKENTVENQKRYYCPSCCDDKVKAAKQYRDLIEYICKLYDIDAPTMVMVKQIKDFKDNHGYSHIGMQSTLEYFYEIQEGNSVDDSMGVGIIPYVYDEAKQFHIDCREIKRGTDGLALEDIMRQQITININRNDVRVRAGYKEIAIIDITDIEEGE
jgi:hypothetical protein